MIGSDVVVVEVVVSIVGGRGGLVMARDGGESKRVSVMMGGALGGGGFGARPW